MNESEKKMDKRGAAAIAEFLEKNMPPDIRDGAHKTASIDKMIHIMYRKIGLKSGDALQRNTGGRQWKGPHLFVMN